MRVRQIDEVEAVNGGSTAGTPGVLGRVARRLVRSGSGGERESVPSPVRGSGATRDPRPRRSRAARRFLHGSAIYVVLILIAWCALIPILWAVSGSLKSDGEITEPSILPEHPRWSNYGRVFDTLPMGRMLFNTTAYALCVTAGQVFFCSLAGYAFARLRFRGRELLFLAYLATLMVPLTVTVIPQFLIMRTLGWVDTPWAMIVPGLFGSAFGTYLMRQFFRTLPTELEEAAILDGCTTWQIYWRVLLPHTRPALMVLAVLTWISVWNDFLWPLIMIQRNEYATATLGLVRLQGQYHTQWPLLMAAAVVVLLPLLALYAVAQRAFVHGIAMSGMGGR
ncbi:carbohydrate ABC transporter permease [Nocardia aurea]|uniref:carbohydrate ABC transporter permease n=1 Tax=Nocardia aurea TaxID=2144174 RepID=UPI0033A919C0